MTEYTIENWFPADNGSGPAYADYWNNEDIEKDKEWYILDGDFHKMEIYLETSGLVANLQACVQLLKDKHGRTLQGIGIDIAAGNLWGVPHLVRQGNVEKIYCLEFSKHRLFKLGPAVLDHYQVPATKVVLALGSFYAIQLPEQSVDFAFISQAFHHADKPDLLLSEIHRILRPGGVVIIIGEHVVNTAAFYVKHFLRYTTSKILSQASYERVFHTSVRPQSFFPATDTVLPVDPVLGDHEYTKAQYDSYFKKFSFSVDHLMSSDKQLQSFILIKKPDVQRMAL